MDITKTLYLLMDILETFMQNSESHDFHCFLNYHLNWIGKLHNDADLYNPIYRQPLTELKELLENPEYHFEEYLDLYREYMTIKYAFKWYEHWTGPYQPMSTFFETIVSDLEYILSRTPSRDYLTMKENNRQFYHDLNAYILHPERLENICCEYGVEWPDYLDAIAV
jgi:hypothetical protein